MFQRVADNGPAIWGGCVTRRSIRQLSWYFSHETVSVQGVWRTFCRHGRNNFEQYECRGTRLIGAANLSPVTKLVAGTGAVSRYKADRSQKVIKVYEALLRVVRESGCNGHYEFVLSAGAKAKSMTNNLPILSVLAFRLGLSYELIY
jgi:hypothetical protein